MVRTVVMQAMEERCVLRIRYRRGGPRLIQPHAILRKPDGSEVLEAYQLRGEGETLADHGWRSFDIAGLQEATSMEEHFEARRDFSVVSGAGGRVVAQISGREPAAVPQPPMIPGLSDLPTEVRESPPM